MKKALMIIAPNNFRDEEFKEPKLILENAGYKIDVASLKKDAAQGMFGTMVNPDLTLEEALNSIDDYSVIIFVGGSGARVYFNNKTALEIAKKSYNHGKIIAAICIAPVILANAGILNGKEATVFNGEEGALEAKGAKFINKDVVISGSIITANGPNAAKEFGKIILKLLG